MTGNNTAPKRLNTWLPVVIGIAVVVGGYILWRAIPISVR